MRLVTIHTEIQYKYNLRPSIFKDYLPYDKALRHQYYASASCFPTVLNRSKSDTAGKLQIKQEEWLTLSAVVP